MKIRKVWLLGITAGLLVVLGAGLAIPAWAASTRQADGPIQDTYAAMHAACQAGDVQGMTEAMKSLTPDDWQAMGEHMRDGHHGAMGSQMMGGSGMMGGQMGRGMMGW